jgi:hypothetical protein
MEDVINEAIHISIVNNLLNMYSGSTRNQSLLSSEILNNNSRILSSRYYNTPPQGGYIVNEEYEYILSDTDDLASLVFLDVATRFGSPGSDNKLMKECRKNKIKKIGSYKKIKDGDLLLNNQCSICIENFSCGEFQRTLCCNHSFHKKCIDKWFKKDKNDCPMCRTKIIED